MVDDRMKIWIRMLYRGFFSEKNLSIQFDDLIKLGFNMKKEDLLPLGERYINIWMGKMSSLATLKPEGEHTVKLQEAINLLSSGNITTMDW